MPFTDLESRFGLTYSKRHLRRLWTAGKFPKPVKVTGSPNCQLNFPEDEVAARVDAIIAARGQD
ncbi:MAG: transcriptional regulator [Mesorhizobium sp.]|nr:MAG: transcriptional regulator [Mesorhizobium sp.]